MEELSLKIKTFWISVLLAIVLPAVGQFFVFSQNQTKLTEMVNKAIEKTDNNRSELSLIRQQINNAILNDTRNSFDQEDWEREEAKIDRKIEALQSQMVVYVRESTETVKRIEDKLQNLLTEMVKIKTEQELKQELRNNAAN